jgi:hypothetical protein
LPQNKLPKAEKGTERFDFLHSHLHTNTKLEVVDFARGGGAELGIR